MSENQNRSARDLSKYDSMETQELEAILRSDFEAPEGQGSDTESILYVMEVLAKRRKMNNTGKTALEAWGSFQRDYLPTEEEALEYTQQTKQAKPVRLGLRRLIAVAAVLALLVGISVTASAFNWADVWNAVAKWAKETFSFVSGSDADLTEPDDRTVQEYTSLQEALGETEINVDFIPTWIPDGYKLEDITTHHNPMQSVYIGIYKDSDKDMKITVRSFLNGNPEKVEINEELLEIYKVSGIEYYIFSNNQQLRAVWYKDSYECYISGKLTVEEIKTMIDSIGKG